MQLSFRHMEVLDAILREGTMSGAAKALGVSQPAISRHVGAAEHILDVELFLRRGTALIPTAELLELRPILTQIFDGVAAAREVGDLLRYGMGRRIQIATTPSFATALLSDAIATLRRAFPQTQIITRVRDAAAIKQGILRGDFDFGIVYNEREAGPTAESIRLCTTEIVCVVPKDHPLADQDEVTPEHLDNVPLISFGRLSAIGLDLDLIFAEWGATRNVAISTGNSFMGLAFVRSGAGLGLCDPFARNTPHAEGLTTLQFRPKRAIAPQVIYARSRALSDPDNCLLAALEETARLWQAT
ncbi:LysR family transcriptional regulator [Roseobacter weihaiensis]|uniref:LysR family transcriptional regulator n=1 Tax=Roseobacter weihaiensis TaxID=2763262 RepID=UPI001D0BE3BE|nr:LysR family transcriptional regulator [Roseobacter sp. H9]